MTEKKLGNLRNYHERKGYQKALDDVLKVWEKEKEDDISIANWTFEHFKKKIEELR